MFHCHGHMPGPCLSLLLMLAVFGAHRLGLSFHCTCLHQHLAMVAGDSAAPLGTHGMGRSLWTSIHGSYFSRFPTLRGPISTVTSCSVGNLLALWFEKTAKSILCNSYPTQRKYK